jgi:hypothetical protein
MQRGSYSEDLGGKVIMLELKAPNVGSHKR